MMTAAVLSVAAPPAPLTAVGMGMRSQLLAKVTDVLAAALLKVRSAGPRRSMSCCCMWWSGMAASSGPLLRVTCLDAQGSSVESAGLIIAGVLSGRV